MVPLVKRIQAKKKDPQELIYFARDPLTDRFRRFFVRSTSFLPLPPDATGKSFR